jgi:chromosome segregation ATPase
MVPIMIKTVLILVMLIAVLPAHAADDSKNAAAKAQLRQVQQDKRKLEQDKAQLEQDKTALDTQLKAAQQSLESAKKSADSASHKTASLQKELEQANAEKSDLNGKLADLQKQLAESEQKLKNTLIEKHAIEQSRAELETNLGQQNQSLSSCEAKNQEQYQYGLELLDKYEKKSCFTSLLQHEPFFGIKQTQIENDVAEYKDKLDKQHLPPPKDAATAEAAAPAASGNN